MAGTLKPIEVHEKKLRIPALCHISLTSGQRILTTGRIALDIFHWENLP